MVDRIEGGEERTMPESLEGKLQPMRDIPGEEQLNQQELESAPEFLDADERARWGRCVM